MVDKFEYNSTNQINYNSIIFSKLDNQNEIKIIKSEIGVERISLINNLDQKWIRQILTGQNSQLVLLGKYY